MPSPWPLQSKFALRYTITPPDWGQALGVDVRVGVGAMGVGVRVGVGVGAARVDVDVGLDVGPELGT
jgi:hypothetical protein